MLKNKYQILTLMLLIFFALEANAFWAVSAKTIPKIAVISKNVKALPDQEIVRLSKLSSETKGTTKVGKELGKLKLSDDLLEDAYIRIAINKGVISRKKAEEMYSSLSGTPGFRTTLRKTTGNSEAVTKGHLNELEIAHSASKSGFKVNAIGHKFNDGIKGSLTDIDVIISKNNKTFIIEAKEYASTTKIPLERYRADLNSLVAYKKANNGDVIPTFTITNRSVDEKHFKILQKEAERRGVQLIYGTPQEQIHKINALSKIL